MKMNNTEEIKGRVAKRIWNVVTSGKAEKYRYADEPYLIAEGSRIHASEFARLMLAMNKSLEDDGNTDFSSSEIVDMCRAYRSSATCKNVQIRHILENIKGYFYSDTGKLHTSVKDGEWVYTHFDHMIEEYNKLEGTDLWVPVENLK